MDKSKIAKALAAMRTNPGRKRDNTQPRCACGQETLKRALARGHKCELVPIPSGSDARKGGNGQDSEGRTGSESVRKSQ